MESALAPPPCGGTNVANAVEIRPSHKCVILSNLVLMKEHSDKFDTSRNAFQG